MRTVAPKVAVSLAPALYDEVHAEAERRFEGSESRMMRESARVYLRLRRAFGLHLDAKLAELTGEEDQERAQ